MEDKRVKTTFASDNLFRFNHFKTYQMNVEQILNNLEKKHPGEVEYLQAVREVLESIETIVSENPQFEANGIIDRIVEPDRILTFKVPWVGDNGKVNVNLGYRVQFNNAIGPYKGGLRFHFQLAFRKILIKS